MLGLKPLSSLALSGLGLLSACGNDAAPDSMTRAAGSSGVAGTVVAGGASSALGGSGRPASGGVDSNDHDGEPAGAGVGSGLSGAHDGGGDGGAPSSIERSSAGAGGVDSIPRCSSRGTTFSLGCEEVVARWSPVYVPDSNQWMLDASAAEHPIQSGSLTFYSSYSTSEFPVCAVVSVEISESVLHATPTMDSHYLITAQIARFRVNDVCGNLYVYEPSGRACGSIAADEASDWRGLCAKTCPGACD